MFSVLINYSQAARSFSGSAFSSMLCGMDIIGIRRENLRRLAEQRGGMARLAEALDRSLSQLSQLIGENPSGNIGNKFARYVEQALGLEHGWLDVLHATPTTEMRGTPSIFEPGPALPGYHRTPVVGLAQLGPDGYYDAIEFPVGHGDGYLDVPTRDPNAYALRVRGDSMFPAIRDGWYVVIEPNRTYYPGDFVMVKTYDGRCMIKELLHERNGEIVLSNVNGSYGRLTLDREQVEKISLVAGIFPPSQHQPGAGA